MSAPESVPAGSPGAAASATSAASGTSAVEAVPGLAPLITTVPPRAPRTVRRTVVRAAALVLAATVALLVLTSLVAGPRRSGLTLDPEGTGDAGARALVQVLRAQGVEVTVVRGIDDVERVLGPGDGRGDWTVVLTDPRYLGQGAAQRLTRAVEQARRLVVVEPDEQELADLGLPVTPLGGGTDDLTSTCASGIARPSEVLTARWSSYGLLPGAAGDARDAADGAPDASGGTGGTGGGDTGGNGDDSGPTTPPLSRSSGGATLCFADPAAPSASRSTDGPDSSRGSGSAPAGTGAVEPSGALVVLPREARAPETVVLGSSRALSNGAVLDGAHAALALRSLGPTSHLLWYEPEVGDLDAAGPDGERVADPGRGVPAWLSPGAWLVAVAVVAFALARGRRLGRVVVEPLPVVVRAAETTEARGRLYHRAADRPVAARALRTGTRARLTERLGLPASTPVGAVVEAAARASGTPRTDVEQLLDGPDPTTDRDLLLLAQRLADLEESVRTA